MNKRIVLLFLIFITILSLFFNVYKKDSVPACLNADEASFGYNAYSILKTGHDEYGTSLPLRLKSFGDYKMPLYSYLSVPFISAFGLSESSTRSLNTVILTLLPLTIFYLVKEFFEDDIIALTSALLVATSLGLQLIARQAHEAPLAVLLITLTSLFFIKFLKKADLKNGFLFYLSLFLSLFSYQSSRIFPLFFFITGLFYLKKQQAIRYLLAGLAFVFVLFLATDVIYKPERIKNLLFFNTAGFSLKINELRGEGGAHLLYNKATIGTQELVTNYLKYFSPQFLAISGDENRRFGFEGMSPITPLEYFFIFVGLYYLFKNKEKWRYFLTALFLISPVTGSLTWAGLSLTRTLFMFIPAIIIISYGAINLIKNLPKKFLILNISLILLIQFSFLFYSWDFYFNHYPKRALTIRSWQCGYKELASYIKNNYDNFDKFYITRKNGQPYIFLLFYNQYSPAKYQKQAVLSRPDEYGFGQVERFDKFTFSLPNNFNEKRAVYVGYPDDFAERNAKNIKKIRIGGEEIFWIYSD